MTAPGPPGRGPTHRPIYLDHNATTPVDPRVVEALLPYLGEHFGNPSSDHAYGTEPKRGLERARRQVAALIAASAEEIVFTGSGSEADNLAVRGAVLAALLARPGRWAATRPQVITQVSEHPAVLQACAALNRLHGVDVTYLPVDGDGRVDPAALAAALTDRTVLVSVMHANNETGVVQPIAELARLAHAAGALLHTDAAQSVGKVAVDVGALGADLLTVVGHKMYAPKGVAALYVRAGTPLEPLIPGGGQERGLRAGTENVALAVALGTAADLAGQHVDGGGPQRITCLRDRLHDRLDALLPGRVSLNGHPTQRLPNTLNVSIAGEDAQALLARVPEVAASTGSACHTGDPEPSPVLRAMGIPHKRALAAVRLSLGRWTTGDDVQRAASLLAGATSR